MEKIITINDRKYQLIEDSKKTTIPSDWDLSEYETWYDEKHCLEAVKQNGYTLQYVKEQTEEICLEAVKQNGYVLQYVKEQTEEICLEAIKQNSGALQYVDKRVFEVDD